MSQEDTLRLRASGRSPRPRTRRVRRAAFEAVGGFREEIRAAEDADLTYRLKAAGWEVERREGAARGAPQPPDACAGSCARSSPRGGRRVAPAPAPGLVAPPALPGLLWWGVRHASKGLAGAARGARPRPGALGRVRAARADRPRAGALAA